MNGLHWCTVHIWIYKKYKIFHKICLILGIGVPVDCPRMPSKTAISMVAVKMTRRLAHFISSFTFSCHATSILGYGHRSRGTKPLAHMLCSLDIQMAARLGNEVFTRITSIYRQNQLVQLRIANFFKFFSPTSIENTIRGDEW